MGEPALDMIVLGEGEMTFRDIIGRLNSGASLAGTDGLAFRDGDRIVVNPRTKWIEDLDSIRFPARDLLPVDAYKKVGIPHSLSFSGKNFAPLITSRGCPARCIYCSSARFWGNRYRFRSPENVLDEIGELISKWDINEIQFEDDNITANPKRAMNIFRGIIDRGYRIRFNFPNGLALWTLDERLVDLMLEAGCYEAILAFESGCQEVLRDIVKKPTNLEKAVKIARYIQRKGIRTDAFYIIGFPGETREQIRQTFRFANKVKTDLAYFFVANPLPGSELHRIAESKGMLRQGFNFEDLAYTRSAYHDGVFPKGELERMAGREFVKYSLRSFLRRPHIFLKRFLFDLFLKRPQYTVKILVRIWRRVVGAGTP
jgi:magnesium-protoporphyrin IX monomethyl ester (oxidative) cyclase